MGARATIAFVTRFGPDVRHAPPLERAAIAGLAFGDRRRDVVDASLGELASLATTAGATVHLRFIQERQKPDAAFFLGRGKVQTFAKACREAGIEVAIFDDELTPGQRRNLEEALSCRVIDRTQLILDIFASRAHTREGKLQVELAQLKHLLPQLTGVGVALSRLGAGIGTRGPGETKLETDRRRIRQRVSRLTRDLDAVRRRRLRSRQRRQKEAVPTVALVGYTNAGKTSLFNLLTGSGAAVSDALFVTLDPLVRPVHLSDCRTVLLSDTVGFIERLPHALVAAFRATLEEVSGADVLLEVVDASRSDREDRMAAVRRVLEEVEANELPGLRVFNKIDRLDTHEKARLRRLYPDAVRVSALSGEGRDALVDAIVAAVRMEVKRVVLELDGTADRDRRRLAQVYRHGRVLRYERDGKRVSVEAEVPSRMVARWRCQGVA